MNSVRPKKQSMIIRIADKKSQSELKLKRQIVGQNQNEIAQEAELKYAEKVADYNIVKVP